MNKSVFPGYLEGSNPLDNIDIEGSRKFMQTLHQRNFYLRDVGISARLFNQWKNYGLVDLPVSAHGRKWVTLNFGEYLWLRVINDLRKLGCPLEDIIRIKERYMADTFKMAIQANKVDVFNDTFWEVARKTGKMSNEQLAQLKKEMAGLNPFDLLGEVFQRPLNFFESMILNMITLRSESYLVLFLTDYWPGIKPLNTNPDKIPDGKKRKKAVRVSTVEFALLSDEFKRMDVGGADLAAIFQVPHIKIPMRIYIREFISDNRNEIYLEELGLLTQEELTLLKEVRKQNVKLITVRFKLDGNEGKPRIQRIEVTKELKKDTEARLVETFTGNEYADITYKVENGKMISFQKTIKIKPGN